MRNSVTEVIKDLLKEKLGEVESETFYNNMLEKKKIIKEIWG